MLTQYVNTLTRVNPLKSACCDPFFGCAPTTVANKAEQGQANIGVIYRFGK